MANLNHAPHGPAPNADDDAMTAFFSSINNNQTIQDGVYGCVTPDGLPLPVDDIDPAIGATHRFLKLAIDDAFKFVSARLGAAVCDRAKLHAINSLYRCYTKMSHAWEWMHLLNRWQWGTRCGDKAKKAGLSYPMKQETTVGGVIVSRMNELMTWTHLARLLLETRDCSSHSQTVSGTLAEGMIVPLIQNHCRAIKSMLLIAASYDEAIGATAPVLLETRPFDQSFHIYVGARALEYFSESLLVLGSKASPWTCNKLCCNDCSNSILNMAQSIKRASVLPDVSAPSVISEKTTLQLVMQEACHLMCQSHMPDEETSEFTDSWPTDNEGHMKTKARNFATVFQKSDGCVKWEVRRECYTISVLYVCRSVGILNPGMATVQEEGYVTDSFRRFVQEDEALRLLRFYPEQITPAESAHPRTRLFVAANAASTVQRLYSYVCFNVCSNASATIHDIVCALDEMCDVVGLWFQFFCELRLMPPISLHSKPQGVDRALDRALLWRNSTFRDMIDLVVALVTNLEAAERLLLHVRHADEPALARAPWLEKFRDQRTPMRRLIAIILAEGSKQQIHDTNIIKSYMAIVDRSIVANDEREKMIEDSKNKAARDRSKRLLSVKAANRAKTEQVAKIREARERTVRQASKQEKRKDAQARKRAKQDACETRKRLEKERLALERICAKAAVAEIAARKVAEELVGRALYEALAPQRAAEQAASERLLSVKAANRAKNEQVAKIREARERAAKQKSGPEKHKDAQARESAALQKRKQDAAARAASRAAFRESKAHAKEAQAAALTDRVFRESKAHAKEARAASASKVPHPKSRLTTPEPTPVAHWRDMLPPLKPPPLKQKPIAAEREAGVVKAGEAMWAMSGVDAEAEPAMSVSSPPPAPHICLPVAKQFPAPPLPAPYGIMPPLPPGPPPPHIHPSYASSSTGRPAWRREDTLLGYKPRRCGLGDTCPRLRDRTCRFDHGADYTPVQPLCFLGAKCWGFVNGNPSSPCMFRHPNEAPPAPSPVSLVCVPLSAPEERRKECAVCLEPYDGQTPTALSCGHVFCGACANPLQRCPTCRKTVTGKMQLFF